MATVNDNSTRTSINDKRSGCKSGCCGCGGCCKVNVAKCKACAAACISKCKKNQKKYELLCQSASKQASAAEASCCKAGNCVNTTFNDISNSYPPNCASASELGILSRADQIAVDAAEIENVYNTITSPDFSNIVSSLGGLFKKADINFNE